MDKKKIMVIDDEVTFTELVKLNLEATGRYQVQCENNGTHALSAIKEFKPDLIFLDIIMPGCDGGEVMHQIRNDEETKDTKVIFLTAVVKEDEVISQDGIIGGHPFLAKPVTPEKLIECLEQHIGK